VVAPLKYLKGWLKALIESDRKGKLYYQAF
jgi:hypothetical protein